MGSATNKLARRREAIAAIERVFKETNVNVIHYSCESFYNKTDGNSPRITSIAIRNLRSGQTSSFSIHQIAERKKLSLGDIEQNYDELEHLMLTDFYRFVTRHSGFLWLHWNMRDINYGFSAIAHRFSVLGGEPVYIEDNRLVDLARVLIARYGPEYTRYGPDNKEHPRLEKLMMLNQISAKDALTGKEEADAFDNKQYIKLHQSTLRKVDVIANIAEREWNGSLRTNSTWRQEFGTSLAGRAEALIDSTWFRVLSVLGAIITVIGFAIQLFQLG
jgi:hypothetical protein